MNANQQKISKGFHTNEAFSSIMLSWAKTINFMLIYQMKLQGASDQYERLDNAIRTGRFVRNRIISAWMNNKVIKLKVVMMPINIAKS